MNKTQSLTAFVTGTRTGGRWLQYLALAAALVTGGFRASAAPADSTLTYIVETAQFHINDSLNLAEVYFAIPRGRLQFVPVGDELRADFEIDIGIYHGEKRVGGRTWQASSYARSAADIRPSQNLFTLASFQMKPGAFNFQTSVRDLNAETIIRRSFDLAVAPYHPTELALSDVEFASRVTKDSVTNIYTKNGFQIIPNPAALYGDGLPLLMTYSEIYNLSYPSDSTFTVRYRVYDDAGNLVKNLPEKEHAIGGSAIVEIGGFNVMSLRSGIYFLEIEVTDNGDAQTVKRRNKFYVYRQQDQLVSTKQLRTSIRGHPLAYFYDERTEKELDQEYDAVQWIAQKEEMSIYPSLDLQGKRDFFVHFWLNRDTDTTTVSNEFRDDYLNRVEYTTQNFGGMKRGWRTDRGRVMLIYGTPDEIERFPSGNNTRAYQIWHYYNVEGGVEFIFVDIRGFGDYDLVHSTARSELSDTNWEHWLYPSR